MRGSVFRRSHVTRKGIQLRHFHLQDGLIHYLLIYKRSLKSCFITGQNCSNNTSSSSNIQLHQNSHGCMLNVTRYFYTYTNNIALIIIIFQHIAHITNRSISFYLYFPTLYNNLLLTPVLACQLEPIFILKINCYC